MTPPALPPLPGVSESVRADSRQPGLAPESTADDFLGILFRMLVGLGAEGKPALLPASPGGDRSGDGADPPDTGLTTDPPEPASVTEAATTRPVQLHTPLAESILPAPVTGTGTTGAGMEDGEIAPVLSAPGKIPFRPAPAPTLPARQHVVDVLPDTQTPAGDGFWGDRTSEGTSPRGAGGESVRSGTTAQTPGVLRGRHTETPPREAPHARPLPQGISGGRMPEVTVTRSARINQEGRSEIGFRPEQGARPEQDVRSEPGVRSENSVRSEQRVRFEYSVRSEQRARPEPGVEPEHGDRPEKPASHVSTSQRVDIRDTKPDFRMPVFLRGGFVSRPAVTEHRPPSNGTPLPEGQSSVTAPERSGIPGSTVVNGDGPGSERQEPVLHLRSSVPPAKTEEGARATGSTRAGGSIVSHSTHSGQTVPRDVTIAVAQDGGDAGRAKPIEPPGGDQSPARAGDATERPSGAHQGRLPDGQTKTRSSGQPAGGEGQTDTRAEVRGTLSHQENTSATHTVKSPVDPAFPKAPVGRPPSLPQELARSVVDQVIRGMELHIDGKAAEMRIRLEPETLGEVGLRVRMSEGRMQAQIDVSQPAVKAAIEMHLPQLRQALADQGINVERLDVFAHGESPSREASDGNAGKGKRRGGRDTGEREPDTEGFRQLGYNTIELFM